MAYNSNIYIRTEMINKLNNFQLLKYLTEEFALFGTFLEEKRGYKKIDLKIGKFKYDGDEYEIFLILDKGPKFKHVRLYDNRFWISKTLTESLIYAWDFETTKFNFNISIINDYWKILNKKDKECYDMMYDDVHANYW